MNKNNNYVVIMAGGVGSRLWPFSRTDYPKQFHDILGTGKSLLQQTADRFQNVCPQENIYIVTNASYKNLVKEQLPFLKDEQILLEPIGRNTAPCIAYSSYKIAHQNPEANILVCPSDHIILKEQVFEEKVLKALEVTNQNDVLVTLGITPTRPDTGYGYIQFEEKEELPYKVKTFREKPNKELAEEFLASGDFVWNAGIFIWSAKSIVNSFKTFLPQLDCIFSEAKKHYYTESEQNFINDNFASCENISIDYGIMEHANNVFMIPADMGWSDLGTWKSIYEVQEKTPEENVLDGNITTYDTTNCIIKTPQDRLVVAQGLDGYIVAEYDNVLMICKKEDEQKVKQFVGDVKEKQQKDFY
ncbi:MAG: mannose-1-phosphate guanylyltransferase [Cytophagales bacterium]|nr:mannose-1-phosphate guanylyltransferase [Cytophagales bacterium]